MHLDSIFEEHNTRLYVFLLHIDPTLFKAHLILSQTTVNVFDSSKLKEFADENLKFDDNDRKFSKWVENTVGKGEIARYEQFLLVPQCFQKSYTAYT